MFSIFFETIILDAWLLLFLVDLVIINKLEINGTEKLSAVIYKSSVQICDLVQMIHRTFFAIRM